MNPIQDARINISLQQLLDLFASRDGVPTLGQLIDMVLEANIPVVQRWTNPNLGLNRSPGSVSSRTYDSFSSDRAGEPLFECDTVSNDGLSHATPSPLQLPSNLSNIGQPPLQEVDSSRAPPTSSPNPAFGAIGANFHLDVTSRIPTLPCNGGTDNSNEGPLYSAYPPCGPPDAFDHAALNFADANNSLTCNSVGAPSVDNDHFLPFPHLDSNCAPIGSMALLADEGRPPKATLARSHSALEDDDVADSNVSKRRRFLPGPLVFEDREMWYCVLRGKRAGIVCGRYKLESMIEGCSDHAYMEKATRDHALDAFMRAWCVGEVHSETGEIIGIPSC